MTRQWKHDGRNPANKNFGTVDGEGANCDDPDKLFGKKHEYMMLRADEFSLDPKRPLHYSDCFNFLASLPVNRIWTGYFFDYDVTMMCRGLTPERARRLFDPIERMNKNSGYPYVGIDVDNKWEISYLPHREFKVRFKDQPWRTISDTSGFFQTSFLRTLDKWNIGTEEQRDQIALGKAQRANFTEEDYIGDDIDKYNALECLLHNTLMEEFRSVCQDVGYVPRKWQGAGQLAAVMLQKHGVPKRDDIPIMSYDKFRNLTNDAYYGGRAESTAIGEIPGPVYQLDINGAYVAALRSLPCLIHGTWKLVHTRPAPGSLWVGHVRFWHPQTSMVYNLPVRRQKDGTIYYPRFARGTYWSWELDAAERAGTGYEFVQGYVYSKKRDCECRPFGWIDEYYAERLRLGKSGKGYVLKLGGNSLYGKMAQSIGAAPWANPVYAGLITAFCRAAIINAYAEEPDSVYMIMTDGLFMRRLPNVPFSKKLGEWELKTHKSLFIVQPGVYFLPDAIKSRGVPMGAVDALQGVFRDSFAQFQRDMHLPQPIPVPVHNFLTMRQALARRKWELAGTWEDTTKAISFDVSSKRTMSGVVVEQDRNIMRTLPIKGSYDVVSAGYKWMIGSNQEISRFDRYDDAGLIELNQRDEAPDWQQPLIAGVELPNRYIHIVESVVRYYHGQQRSATQRRRSRH